MLLQIPGHEGHLLFTGAHPHAEHSVPFFEIAFWKLRLPAFCFCVIPNAQRQSPPFRFNAELFSVPQLAWDPVCRESP
jgi:hypothetical protein